MSTRPKVLAIFRQWPEVSITLKIHCQKILAGFRGHPDVNQTQGHKEDLALLPAKLKPSKTILKW